MRFEEIREFLGNIPYNAGMIECSMDPQRGQVMYQHIRKYKPLSVLELGIGYGFSSCYMAAALHENGAGHLTCVDLSSATYSPSAEKLVSLAKLTEYVSIYREKSSYTWFLKKLIDKHSPPHGVCEPQFELCYIDGPKNWTVDGAAFFMVDKLLKEEGCIIFDDYNWVYGPDYDGNMSDDEKTQPHVEAIFRLLVIQHPNYGDFLIDGNRWAWARKVHSDNRTIRLTYTPDLRHIVYTKMRSLYRELRSAK